MIDMALPPSSREELNCIWKYKAIGVSQGQLKFIDIDRRATVHDCHITIWSLDTDGYIWRLQQKLEVGHCRPESPSFPLPDGVDPDILYFMTSVARAGTHQVYAVSWRTATLLFRYPYAEDRVRVLEEQTPYVGSEITPYVTNPPDFAAARGELHELHDGGDGAYQFAILEAGVKRAKSQKLD